MSGFLPISLDAVVVDCKDIVNLSNFYVRLLGWTVNYVEPKEWIDIISPDKTVKIAFQYNEDYIPPVWPEKPGMQQQMVHLDFKVAAKEHLNFAVQHALACGAVKAPIQYGESEDKFVTFFDSEGHPFCFVLW